MTNKGEYHEADRFLSFSERHARRQLDLIRAAESNQRILKARNHQAPPDQGVQASGQHRNS